MQRLLEHDTYASFSCIDFLWNISCYDKHSASCARREISGIACRSSCKVSVIVVRSEPKLETHRILTNRSRKFNRNPFCSTRDLSPVQMDGSTDTHLEASRCIYATSSKRAKIGGEWNRTKFTYKESLFKCYLSLSRVIELWFYIMWL
jgi:hypothetical protein